MSNDGMESYFVRSLAVRRVCRVLCVIGVLGGLAMVVIGLIVAAGNKSIGVHNKQECDLIFLGLIISVLCVSILCITYIRGKIRKNSVIVGSGKVSDHDAKGKTTNVGGAGWNYGALDRDNKW